MSKHSPSPIWAINKVVLFGTSACHLCDDAEKILTALVTSNGYVKLDIAFSDELMSQYAERIPVVRSEDGRELSWPFDHDTAKAFFTQPGLAE